MIRQHKLIIDAVKHKFKHLKEQQKLPSFLDYASEKHGGSYPELEVEGVRSQFRMLPIFFTGVFYSCTYAQVCQQFMQQISVCRNK